MPFQDLAYGRAEHLCLSYYVGDKELIARCVWSAPLAGSRRGSFKTRANRAVKALKKFSEYHLWAYIGVQQETGRTAPGQRFDKPDSRCRGLAFRSFTLAAAIVPAPAVRR